MTNAEEIGECETAIPPCWRNPTERATASGRLCAQDARAVCLYTHVHACAKSRFKYADSRSRFLLCRRGFYRVDKDFVYDEDIYRLLPRHRIRRGKRLIPRPTIANGVNDGTQGEVLTRRTHPLRGPTSPVGLVSMRCNLDVQCMR